MARVIFDGVTKRYAGGVEAVSNLSMEIQDREFLVWESNPRPPSKGVHPEGVGKRALLGRGAPPERQDALPQRSAHESRESHEYGTDFCSAPFSPFVFIRVIRGQYGTDPF